MNKNSFFNKVMLEADGDDAPSETNDNSPPDINNEPPPDISEDNNSPPDISDGTEDNSPPDIDFNEEEDDPGFEDEEQPEENDENNNLGFDEKISAIMNMNLYQRFLSLLNTVGGQISMVKRNSDMLYTISNESLDILESLKKLDENIRLYLSNYFLDENFSKNLLFLNKCINLLKLLNTIFEKNIKKGIKSLE